MNNIFNTPQDAEDAYYDALEAGDLNKLLSIWDSTDDISCLLPMQPLVNGRSAVEKAFRRLLSHGGGIELTVEHLSWIETDDVAIHTVEETARQAAPDEPPPMPVYGTNIFRKRNDGWHLIVHYNAPTPPPPPTISPDDW